MNRLAHHLYQEDLDHICRQNIHWDSLSSKTVAVTGATGMIGTVLVDALLKKNDIDDLNCQVVAIGRSYERLSSRFPYKSRDDFRIEELDVSSPGSLLSKRPDYIIHLASSTHPRQYAAQPIATITSNVIGSINMLDSLRDKGLFTLASSVEIYGQNRGDTSQFEESYCGYIDCNTLRAGYPESKRVCEALCQAYSVERGIRVSIPRLPRTYGPTLLRSDSKALSQFLWNGLKGEDIVLKSRGNQYFSYQYVADVVSGMLWATLNGAQGMAYNIADPSSDITLSNLAQCVADICGVSVVFDLPDAEEASGYSTATVAALDGLRLKNLGWDSKYGIRDGLERTISMLGVIDE